MVRTAGSRVSTWVSAAAAALLPLTLVACGDETAGPEAGADVEDVVEDDFFGSDEYVGEEVTLSSTVTEVISPKGFVLAGEDYGDESLLVLSGSDVQNVQEGQVIQVTGTVQEFIYADYSAEFELIDPGLYEPYEDEEFLVAQSIDKTIDSVTPSG